jgi:hypothetical protein
MILNSYIHEQLPTAHRSDLLEAAERDRLAAPTRTHDRHGSRALSREVRRPRPTEGSVCGSVPRTVRP